MFANRETVNTLMAIKERRLADARKEYAQICKDSAPKTQKMRLDMLNEENDASNIGDLNDATEAK